MLTTTDSRAQLIEALSHRIERHVDRPWSGQFMDCVPQLVDLLEQIHDRPVSELADSVRSIVSERCRLRAQGERGRIEDYAYWSALGWLIHEMERLRRAELRCGEWSDLPVPPQMFG